MAPLSTSQLEFTRRLRSQAARDGQSRVSRSTTALVASCAVTTPISVTCDAGPAWGGRRRGSWAPLRAEG